MGYFYAFGTQPNPVAATETEIPGAQVTIPEGHRAVVRRFLGFTLDGATTELYLNVGALGNPIFGTARAGIGPLGGETFVYVDALAGDVTLLASVVAATGGLLCGCAFSGIYQ